MTVAERRQAGEPTSGEPMSGEPAPGVLRVGQLIELQIDGWANGGQCVARHEGMVVFVRHALPGERVRARLTDVRAKLARADAIEVLDASPDRVEAPCRYAGPGGCGGCDLQHVALPAQRASKAAVVIEQLVRLGGLSEDHVIGRDGLRLADLEVVPVSTEGSSADSADGDEVDGLGWRTRVRFAVDAQGRPGMRAHRSHQLVHVDRCLIAARGVDDLVLPGPWRGAAEVEGIASSDGDRLVVVTPSQPDSARRGRSRGPRPKPVHLSVKGFRDILAEGATLRIDGQADGIGRGWVRERVALDSGEVSARVTGSGFWQVHPGAPAALTAAVLDQLDPQPGDGVLDLYGGVGLFSLAAADRVGETGSVTLIEADERAAADARRNLHQYPMVRCVAGRVEQALDTLDSADLIVLDPPRTGAGLAVIDRIAALGPRRISYVACDPAAFARDVRYLGERGYELTALTAFDVFPMTHHVECVALLRKAGSGLE